MLIYLGLSPNSGGNSNRVKKRLIDLGLDIKSRLGKRRNANRPQTSKNRTKARNLRKEGLTFVKIAKKMSI